MTDRGRRGLFILAGVVVLVVLVRLALDPIATYFVRRSLNQGEGFRGAITSAHVNVVPPALEVRRLKIIERPGGRWDEPLFYSEIVRLDLHWRELLKRHLVAEARFEKPKLIVVRRHEAKKKKAPQIGEVLEEKAPLRVDRIEVVDGELLFAEAPGAQVPRVWIHDLEMTVENVATRKALARGIPTTLTARAKIQRTGRATLFVSMDPWAKGLTFAGRAALEKLSARELHPFVAPETGLSPTQGTVSVHAEFTVKGGRITGGIKPVLENIQVVSAEEGLGNKIKAWLADEAIELASDRVAGRNAIATTIPIRGTISDPDVQLVPAVLGVIRNAFVAGLAGGFSNLPPPTSDQKEGLLKQVKDALDESQGPPKAQPGDVRGRRVPPKRQSR